MLKWPSFESYDRGNSGSAQGQPHGTTCVLLVAATRLSAARMKAVGPQRKRSHLLFEAAFMMADRAITPTRTNVPHRAKTGDTSETRKPERLRMMSVASTLCVNLQ
jgi:hypothetical protein